MDTFILGAGFSKAVHPAMPLTQDLGNALVARCGEGYLSDETSSLVSDVLVKLFDHDVEKWLSYLQGEAPYLKDPERLRNLAASIELVDNLVVVIRESEDELWAGDVPDWLARLTRHWHSDRSTVVTLNYDTIVERAALAFPPENGLQPSVGAMYCHPMKPLLARTGVGLIGGEARRAFRLAKLHGSVSWFSQRGGERTNPTSEVFFDSQSNPTFSEMASKVDLLMGLEPMILPPAMTKSRFYDESLIRSQWKFAREAIEQCDRLFIVGCSLRPADFDLSNLLSVACDGPSSEVFRFEFRVPKDVYVVDKSEVAYDRATERLGREVRKDFMGGESPVSRMVDALAARSASQPHDADSD